MKTTNDAFNSYKFISQKAALVALDDYQLKELLSNATRRNVRAMFEFRLVDIEGAINYLGIDTRKGATGFGDKRKKSTFIKMAIQTLSVFHFDDIDKAVDKLSYALGIQDNSLEPDEQIIYDARMKAIDDEVNQPTIDAVAVQPQTKKVTKAQQKLEKNLKLNSQPASVKWESDFMGEVSIGKEVREFWIQDPYTDPVVNLVTSSGAVILSAWESTKENPFMRAVVREFHELLATRGNPSLIEDRLMTIALQLIGSKKRADWHSQSHESLVLTDGKKMNKDFKSLGSLRLQSVDDFVVIDLKRFEDFDLSLGKAYVNAQHYARLYPKQYDYVEGFALVNNRLIHHAWLQDKTDGKAIDVTLQDTDQLLGISLDIGWVDKVIASRPHYGSISPRFSQSIIEGDLLGDFEFLKSGLISKPTAW